MTRVRLVRRPLLVTASVEHAADCARLLHLPANTWDFLADNQAFCLHLANAQVVVCTATLTDAHRHLLNQLQIDIADALVLRNDGTLHDLEPPLSSALGQRRGAGPVDPQGTSWSSH